MKEKWCKAMYRRQRDCKQKKKKRWRITVEESLFSAIASQNRWGASSTQAKQRGFPLEEKESALVEAINVPSFFPSSFLSFAGLSTSPVMQSQVLVASRVQLPLNFLRTPISFISRQRGGEKKKEKKDCSGFELPLLQLCTTRFAER